MLLVALLGAGVAVPAMIITYRYMTPPMFAHSFYLADERSIFPGVWSQTIRGNLSQVLAVDERINMAVIVTSASPPDRPPAKRLLGGYHPQSTSSKRTTWRFDLREVIVTPLPNTLLIVNPSGEEILRPLEPGAAIRAFETSPHEPTDYRIWFDKEGRGSFD
jgi:hypothetical protein